MIQAAGISQDEHIRNAIERADAAVRDVSRKGHSFVLLAVYFLSQESFEKFISHLKEYGYTCTDLNWGERVSKVTVHWQEPAA